VLINIIVASLALAAADAPPAGDAVRLTVAGPTRLDWTFAVGSRSLSRAPAVWLGDYQSAGQSYQCYIPPQSAPPQGYPAVVFISSSTAPAGWEPWREICRDEQVVFAAPCNAGNECPLKQRIRIVLDVLDDLRRRAHLDPDRTYLAGISGGGRVACMIGFALPEYFGGLAPLCAGGELRPERWLWHRLTERESVACVTGENDFNRTEVERYRMPLLQAMHVRSRLWVVPGLGHAIPGPPVLREVYRWLEEGLPGRRALAQRWPASREADASPRDRRSWSEALFEEGRQRLAQPELLFSGLMQLKGVMNRWPDLPAGKKAQTLLADYSHRPDRPWVKADLDEKRVHRVAEARAAADYATGRLIGPYANLRGKLAKAALEKWRDILERHPEGELLAEARRRIAELEKLAGK
jgi:pimeloyl-ACP methyl ester carboxylesterase